MMINRIIKRCKDIPFALVLYKKFFKRHSFSENRNRLKKAICQSFHINKTGNSGRAYELFRKVLLKGCKCERLPDYFVKKYFDSLMQINNLVYPDNYLRDELYSCTKEIEPDNLSCDQWLLLTQLSLENGLFELSGIMRDKAIRRAYDTFESNNFTAHDLQHYYKAAVDQGEYVKALDVLRNCSGKVNTKFQNSARQHVDLIRSGVTRSIHDNILDGETNIIFNDLIEGKKIAIVGPAPTGINAGTDIDQSDVVVRLSYQGKEKLPNRAEFGSRTDISYYGNVNAGLVNKMPNKDFINDLDFAVFKTVVNDYQKELITKRKGRVFFSPNNHFFVGTANLVQLAIYDLLHFNPQEIRLFNVNLFLSKRSHYKGYLTIADEIDNIFWRWGNFAHHNIVTNFNFIKNLHKTEMLKVDKVCEDVLQLTVEDYLQEMAQIYVKSKLKCV